MHAVFTGMICAVIALVVAWLDSRTLGAAIYRFRAVNPAAKDKKTPPLMGDGVEGLLHESTKE